MCLQTCKYPGVHDPFRGTGEEEGKIKAKNAENVQDILSISSFCTFSEITFFVGFQTYLDAR